MINKKKKNTLLCIGRVIILTIFLLGVVLPIYWLVITALKPAKEIIDVHNITYYPHSITLENFRELFDMYNYGSLLKNSVTVSASSAIAITVLSMFGGYSLARYKFRGKTSILFFFLITQMIPGILVLIPLYIIFSNVGLVNTHLGLFIYYVIVNLPFCTITMRSFFERIPVTLEEAASVDGCSKIQSIFKIVLPIMFPGIVSVFAFGFIGSWNELIAGTIFISTPDMWTIPVGLKSLIGKYSVDWGIMMAGGVLALLPTAIMFAIMQKFIVEGMTAGAVKE